jgi:hypothetical protein
MLGQLPDNCAYWAAQNALPALNLAYANTPSGSGPHAWAALGQPFGAGPVGPTTLFSPPGLVPVYGPLGPGNTAAAIAVGAIPPGGWRPSGVPATDFRNTLTLVGLGALQQAELGNLYTRYGLSATYQAAEGFLSQAYSAQAAAAVPILGAMCRSQQRAAGATR